MRSQWIHSLLWDFLGFFLLLLLHFNISIFVALSGRTDGHFRVQVFGRLLLIRASVCGICHWNRITYGYVHCRCNCKPSAWCECVFHVPSSLLCTIDEVHLWWLLCHFNAHTTNILMKTFCTKTIGFALIFGCCCSAYVCPPSVRPFAQTFRLRWWIDCYDCRQYTICCSTEVGFVFRHPNENDNIVFKGQDVWASTKPIKKAWNAINFIVSNSFDALSSFDFVVFPIAHQKLIKIHVLWLRNAKFYYVRNEKTFSYNYC